MITTLEIQNFQSHEESHLIFHPGVNIIIGNSDSGKTAIIRALRKLIWNKPAGDAMRSTWGGETRIRVETEEGSVVWTKDKVDKYTLNTTPSGKNTVREGLEFKAFGTSVPEEINRFLNINEINLQQQLDSPFLLSETPGEIARHFNKVAKLDKIDLAMQNINSWLRDLTSDIKYRMMDQAVFEVQLKKFEHLEKFEAEVEVLEEMNRRYIISLQRQTKLETFIGNIKDVNADIKELKPLLELEEPLIQIFKLKKQKEDLEIDGGRLFNDIKKIKEIQIKIEDQQYYISMETPVINLLTLYKELNTQKSAQNFLFKAISSLRSVNICLKTAEVEKVALAVKFNKEFPDRCPLCGLLVPHEH